MSLTMTLEVPVSFQRLGPDSHQKRDCGVEAARLPAGRVPRVARLMALALRLDELVRTGQVASYSALASLGQVTRAHQPNRQPAPLGPRPSGGNLVFAADAAGPRCHYSG
jgi:hypothetical protein